MTQDNHHNHSPAPNGDAGEAGSRLASRLARRQQLTDALADSPYDCILYLRRAVAYARLGYPDLAAGDAYRALLLTDEASDDSFEYHEQAVEALGEYADDNSPPEVLQAVADLHPEPAEGEDETEEDDRGPASSRGVAGARRLAVRRLAVRRLAFQASVRCFQILARSLALCGSLRSAYGFCARGLAAAPHNRELLRARQQIRKAAVRRGVRGVQENDDDGKNDENTDSLIAAKLPDRGLVRREIYPWNDHEPNRCSPEALAFLNAQLAQVAPKCEVRATELPVLVDPEEKKKKAKVVAGIQQATCLQLGIFAKEAIAPGEAVLREYTLLTANNRHKESACDACGSELPDLLGGGGGGGGGDEDACTTTGPVACPDCDDTVFCDAFCRDQALAAYHPAVCDKDVDAIAKDPEDAREADDALYVLLLARLLAMAAHQEVHPLEVDAVKYIWGDFVPAPRGGGAAGRGEDPPEDEDDDADPGDDLLFGGTLPFSFATNIATPLHILEKMDIDVFAERAAYDTWVFNTGYAKFRGTASARKSRWDGRPDGAAVHPLWCLANHDCDPNVTWAWGGRMVLWARETRVVSQHQPAGLRPGDEVLNHYCDVTLPVQERREWASGSLGGYCMCRRCREEAAAEAKAKAEAEAEAEAETDEKKNKVDSATSAMEATTLG